MSSKQFPVGRMGTLTFVLCAAYSTVAISLALSQITDPFRAPRSYIGAVADYLAGRDPYGARENPFIYNPYVLKLFVAIDSIAPLELVLITSYVASIIFFVAQIFIISRERLKDMGDRRHAAIFLLILSGAFGYGGVGAVSLVIAGNLSAYFHMTLVGVLLKFIRSRSVLYLYFLIFLIAGFSVVKPYYLAYLLLIFIHLPWKSALRYSVSTSILVALIWISARYSFPAEYLAFTTRLNHHLFDQGSLGYGLFAWILPHLQYNGALLAHLFVGGIVVYFFGFLVPRFFQIDNDNTLRSLLLIPAIVLLNPRLLDYDFIIAITYIFFFMLFIYRENAIAILLIGLGTATLPFLVRPILGSDDNFAVNLYRASSVFELLGLVFIVFTGLCMVHRRVAVSCPVNNFT